MYGCFPQIRKLVLSVFWAKSGCCSHGRFGVLGMAASWYFVCVELGEKLGAVLCLGVVMH